MRLSKRSFSWAPYHEIGFASIVSFFICLSFFSALFVLRKILLAPRACDISKEINVNYPPTRCCRRRRNCKIMSGSVPRMAIYRRAWSRKKLIIYREPSGASSSQNVKWKQLKVMCRDCDYFIFGSWWRHAGDKWRSREAESAMAGEEKQSGMTIHGQFQLIYETLELAANFPQYISTSSGDILVCTQH